MWPFNKKDKKEKQVIKEDKNIFTDVFYHYNQCKYNHGNSCKYKWETATRGHAMSNRSDSVLTVGIIKFIIDSDYSDRISVFIVDKDHDRNSLLIGSCERDARQCSNYISGMWDNKIKELCQDLRLDVENLENWREKEKERKRIEKEQEELEKKKHIERMNELFLLSQLEGS